MSSTQKNDTMTLSLVILLAMVLTFPAPGMAAEAGAGRALPAFPGAEGWGSDTPGGRGGKVMIVTNLNPDGPGSLQEACAAKGPRRLGRAAQETGRRGQEEPRAAGQPRLPRQGHRGNQHQHQGEITGEPLAT